MTVRYYEMYDDAAAALTAPCVSPGEKAIINAILALCEQVQGLRRDLTGDED